MDFLTEIFKLLTDETISDVEALEKIAILKPTADQVFTHVDENDSLEHVIDGTVITWISLLPLKYCKKPVFVFDTTVTDFTTYLRRLKLAFENDSIPFDEMSAYDGFLFDFSLMFQCDLMRKIGDIFFDMFEKDSFIS